MACESADTSSALRTDAAATDARSLVGAGALRTGAGEVDMSRATATADARGRWCAWDSVWRVPIDRDGMTVLTGVTAGDCAASAVGAVATTIVSRKAAGVGGGAFAATASVAGVATSRRYLVWIQPGQCPSAALATAAPPSTPAMIAGRSPNGARRSRVWPRAARIRCLRNADGRVGSASRSNPIPNASPSAAGPPSINRRGGRPELPGAPSSSERSLIAAPSRRPRDESPPTAR